MNMSKCRVFFLLFSFSNYTFLSIQAPIPQDGENTLKVPRIINYEKEALEMIGVTAAPGCTVDWKIAFLKLVPVAIIALEKADRYAAEAKENEVEAKRNEVEAKRNENKTKETEIDAGRYRFILLSRNKFLFHEKHDCIGMPAGEGPAADKEFLKRIKEDARFKDIPDERFSYKFHAKKWLWILVKADSNVFRQLNDLRNRLNKDPYQFLWFADQVQRIFDVFNDDVYSPASSILDPKYVDVNKIGTDLSYLSTDVKNALKIFYESEGFNVKINKT